MAIEYPFKQAEIASNCSIVVLTPLVAEFAAFISEKVGGNDPLGRP